MISGQLVPIRRDLDIAFKSDFSLAARSQHLADVARTAFAAAEAVNFAVTGQRLASATFVDGREGAALESVRPDGTLSRVFDLLPLALTDTGDMLRQYSPVKTGAYQNSHVLLADGAEIAAVTDGWQAPAIAAGVGELVFIPTVAYARRIEPADGRKAWSDQAPDGVYHVVAEIAQQTYGKLARFTFGYRELAGTPESAPERRARRGAPRDLRQPVIVVRPL